MNYRLATIDDIEQINNLCKEEGLEKPTLQFCFVAEENGIIIGYINSMKVSAIDIVCKNSVASKTLFDMMNGSLISNNQIIFAMTVKENVKKLLNKLGFKLHKNNMDVFLKG